MCRWWISYIPPGMLAPADIVLHHVAFTFYHAISHSVCCFAVFARQYIIPPVVNSPLCMRGRSSSFASGTSFSLRVSLCASLAPRVARVASLFLTSDASLISFSSRTISSLLLVSVRHLSLLRYCSLPTSAPLVSGSLARSGVPLSRLRSKCVLDFTIMPLQKLSRGSPHNNTALYRAFNRKRTRAARHKTRFETRHSDIGANTGCAKDASPIQTRPRPHERTPAGQRGEFHDALW